MSPEEILAAAGKLAGRRTDDLKERAVILGAYANPSPEEAEELAIIEAALVARRQLAEKLANDPHLFAAAFGRVVTGATKNGYRSRKVTR